MKKNEGKYFYTASLMNQALLDLLEKKDIDFISVTEITKKAGVNRSTFYLHYDNIYELLDETIENTNKKFADAMSIKAPFQISTKKEAFLLTDDFLISYLEFCKEHKQILKLAHKRPNLFRNKDVYQRMYEAIFYPAISQFVKAENDRIYMLEFFTHGVVAVINKWVELDCVAPMQEIVRIINKCVDYDINEKESKG